MKTLEKNLNFLNDYPQNQNVRPLWIISSDGKKLLYYRMWSDNQPELTLKIEDALKCKTSRELQEKMGI